MAFLLGASKPQKPALVDAYQQSCLIYQVDRYRGRTCYDTVTQVADAFLREQTGQQAIDAFQHLATNQLATDQWEVQFRTTQIIKFTTCSW